MTRRRWLIEVNPKSGIEEGSFVDMGADEVEVEYGALVFRDGVETTAIYAAGTWLSCVPNHEEADA